VGGASISVHVRTEGLMCMSTWWAYRWSIPPGETFEVCLSWPFQLTAASRPSARCAPVVLCSRAQQRRVFALVVAIIVRPRLQGSVTRAEFLVDVDVLDKRPIHVGGHARRYQRGGEAREGDAC
jgi:hypothetical protein